MAFFQLTSGSTGIPKCIQETHHGIICHIHASQQVNAYGSDDVTLNWLPFDHVVPLLMYHVKDTYLGCQQIQASTATILADPLTWLDLIARYGVTHTWSPNFGYKLLSDRLAKAPGRSWDLSTIAYFLNAGQGFLGPVPLLWRSRARFHGAASWTQTARSGRWQTGRATGAGIASPREPFS